MTDLDHATTAASPSKFRRQLSDELIDLLRTAGVAVLAVVVLHTTLFQPFTIPSSSMEPGLVTGDYIVVSKFAYGWSGASPPIDLPFLHGRLFGRAPRRGDVVVFRLPRDPSQIWVKRLIGLPGDRVQVRQGTVFVNGQPLVQTPQRLTQDHDDSARPVLETREQLADGSSHILYDGGPNREGDDTGVYVVPAGQYFMMGDNRDNSLDSRWPREVGGGFLPTENVLGQAELVVAAWKPGSAFYKPWTWFSLQPDRFLLRIH